jgi:hypothetical protein
LEPRAFRRTNEDVRVGAAKLLSDGSEHDEDQTAARRGFWLAAVFSFVGWNTG